MGSSSSYDHRLDGDRSVIALVVESMTPAVSEFCRSLVLLLRLDVRRRGRGRGRGRRWMVVVCLRVRMGERESAVGWGTRLELGARPGRGGRMQEVLVVKSSRGVVVAVGAGLFGCLVGRSVG